MPGAQATLRGVLRGVPATIADGLRLGTRDALIRRILLSAGAAGTALVTIELLTPGRAAELTGAAEPGAVVFAALASAGFVRSALGSHLAPLVARLADSGERAVQTGLAAGAAGLVLLGATVTSSGTVPTALAGGGYGLVYLGLGAAGPSENELLHRRVAASGRATALSEQSLSLQLVGAAAGPAVGALSAGPLPWLLGAVALLAAALLWTRRAVPAGDPREGRPAADTLSPGPWAH